MSFNAGRVYKHLHGQQVLVLGEMRIRPDGTAYIEFPCSGCQALEVTRRVGIAARGDCGGLDEEYKRYRCGQCFNGGYCETETREKACEFFIPIPDGDPKPLTCRNCPHVKFEYDWCHEHCPMTDEWVYEGTLACGYHPEHPEHSWYAEEEASKEKR